MRHPPGWSGVLFLLLNRNPLSNDDDLVFVCKLSADIRKGFETQRNGQPSLELSAVPEDGPEVKWTRIVPAVTPGGCDVCVRNEVLLLQGGKCFVLHRNGGRPAGLGRVLEGDN